MLMVLGALLFTLPLHGRQAASDASDTAVMEGTRSDQPIPPAVMKELEAMKKRIEHLKAQIQKRNGQEGTASSVKGTAEGYKGPSAPEVSLASAPLAQPTIAQTQSETAAGLPAPG